MKHCSVVGDIADEQAVNCKLTQAVEVITVDGVKIVGLLNLPGMLAFHASKLYSKNVLSLLSLLIKEEKPVFDFEDEIILDRKSTRLNSSHVAISYAVFCLKKKTITIHAT